MKNVQLIRVIVAPLRIAEGLVMLITLGLFCPTWEMTFLIWNTKRLARKSVERNEPQECAD